MGKNRFCAQGKQSYRGTFAFNGYAEVQLRAGGDAPGKKTR